MWDDLERFGTEFNILSKKKPAHQEEATELELEVNQKIIDHSDILYVFYTPDKEDIALNRGIEIAAKQKKTIYYIPYDTLELRKLR